MRFPIALLGALGLLLAACAPATDEATATTAPAGQNERGTATDAGRTAPPPGFDSASDDVPRALALPTAGSPEAPDDPRELAEKLTEAARVIRSDARTPAELEAAGHWQQVVYRKLVRNQDRLNAVLAAMPPELHDSVRANVFAGARLAAMHPPRRPDEPVKVRELPDWRIIEPPGPEELKSYYEEAQAVTGVHWTYLAAVNLVETRMGRIRGDSVAGAQGPMQFMPATWDEWGEGDVHNPRDAILAAARYLRWGGMPDDVNGALFRYNRDVRYVDAVRTYAEQMQADPRTYEGYYHWQVYFNTGVEHVWLEPGYVGPST